ncbi:hypothetical protein [Methylocystis sp.]
MDRLVEVNRSGMGDADPTLIHSMGGDRLDALVGSFERRRLL